MPSRNAIYQILKLNISYICDFHMLCFDAIYTAYILYHMNSVSVGDSFMNDLNHEEVQVDAQQYAGSISSPPSPIFVVMRISPAITST